MLHRSTYRQLTTNEIAGDDGLDAREQSMARVYDRLGSWVLPRELEDIRLQNILQYNLYEDETHNNKSFPQLAEELKLMPEVEYLYKGANILLSRRAKMARGHVVALIMMSVEMLWAGLMKI